MSVLFIGIGLYGTVYLFTSCATVKPVQPFVYDSTVHVLKYNGDTLCIERGKIEQLNKTLTTERQ